MTTEAENPQINEGEGELKRPASLENKFGIQ